MKKKYALGIIGQAVAEEYLQADVESALQLEQAAPHVVSCSKGCAACCKLLIIISTEEAIAIASAYPQVLRGAREKLLAQEAKLESLHIAVCEEQSPGSALTEETDLRDSESLAAWREYNDKLSALWLNEREPCVFLQPDNTCGVYAMRPVACRMHFVVSDPALCGAPAETLVAKLSIKEEYSLRKRLAELAGDISAHAYFQTQLLAFLTGALDKEDN